MEEAVSVHNTVLEVVETEVAVAVMEMALVRLARALVTVII